MCTIHHGHDPYDSKGKHASGMSLFGCRKEPIEVTDACQVENARTGLDKIADGASEPNTCEAGLGIIIQDGDGHVLLI